jgi:mono/diheme cytochrome c family protein
MRSSTSWRTAPRALEGAFRAALAGAALLAAAGCTAPPPPRQPPPDPDRTIAEAVALTGDPAAGRIVFRSWCIFCHGDQQGGEPPTDFGLGDENPRRFRGFHDLTRDEHIAVVVKGYVSKQSHHRNMPSFLLRISARDIADVVSYERGIMALTDPYVMPDKRPWEGLPDWYRPDLGTGDALR